MPIYVYNRLVYVSSFKEFKRGYKNLNNKKRSVSEAIENPGYDLGASVKVLDSLFVQQIDNHKNDFISRIFGFDFILNDARNVVLELLVFFTYFYHKSAKILDSTYHF